MAHDGKRGFFSSLFGKKKRKEEEETAELESKHRLEERIQQILAEKISVPEVFVREKHAALMIQKEKAEPEAEAEVEIELLPISASAITRRKAPVRPAFVLASFDEPRTYVANER
jgi:hypothetical protein